MRTGALSAEAHTRCSYAANLVRPLQGCKALACCGQDRDRRCGETGNDSVRLGLSAESGRLEANADSSAPDGYSADLPGAWATPSQLG